MGLASTNTRPVTIIDDDGGRRAAGFKGKARDCVCRSIAIVTKRSYADVYSMLKTASEEYANTRRNKVARLIKRRGASPRNGVFKEVYTELLGTLGMEYVSFGAQRGWLTDIPTNTNCIVRYPKHLTAYKMGVLHDTNDPRVSFYNGEYRERKVLGYFVNKEDSSDIK